MPKRGARPTGMHFGLVLNGVIKGYFTECSGLSSEQEVKEFREAGDEGPQATRKLPGLNKYGNITLKRGFADKSLWDWRQQVEDGDIGGARQDGAIVIYDHKRKEVARWDIKRAWPAKISYLPPQAESTEMGSEELIIAVEHIRRVS